MLRNFFIATLFFLLASSIQAQNVGIGTTMPNQKLDINKGRMRFTGNPGPGISQGIEFTDPAGTALNGFVGVYNDSITGMYGFQGSGWSFLHNNKNGNVGLQGNANPRTALSFSNAIGNKISIYDNGDGTQYGIGLQSAKLQLYVPSAAQDIVFGTGNSSDFAENMRIRGNGMVGIGTPAPDKPLVIKTNGMGVSQESNDGTAKVGFFTGINAAYVQTHNNTNLNFSTNNGSAQMTLQAATGNVGIGQPNPSAKLDVAGTIKINDGTQGLNKVLTSDAAGNASWQNSAYGNTERFQFQLYVATSQSGIVITNYNLGTATTTYSTGNQFFNVRILSAGLYHFDASCYISITDNYSSTGDSKTADFLMYNFNTSNNLSKVFCPYTFYASDNTSRASGSISMDMYVPASTNIRFSLNQFENGTFEKRIVVTGHKIAD